MNHRVFSCARCGKIPPLGAVRKLRRFMLGGLTKMDIDGICIGSVDEPLCQVGIKKATEAAVSFAAICEKSGDKIDLVVTSPMKRAVATGIIFAKHLKAITAIENLLAERTLGEAEGKPKNPDGNVPLLRYWGAPKGAGSQKKFEEATLSFIDELWLSSSRFGSHADILFVTHALRMLTIIKIIKGWHINKMPKFVPPKSCEIKTFGIGQPCEQCNSYFYEPIELKRAQSKRRP